MTKEEIAKMMAAATPEQQILFAGHVGHLDFVPHDALKEAELKGDAAQTTRWQEELADHPRHARFLRRQQRTVFWTSATAQLNR